MWLNIYFREVYDEVFLVIDDRNGYDSEWLWDGKADCFAG